jgi:hypothetical protein
VIPEGWGVRAESAEQLLKEKLVTGDNFYEQPPFHEIFNGIGRAYDIQPTDIAYLTTRLLSKWETCRAKPAGERDTEMKLYLDKISASLPAASRTLYRGRQADLRSAIGVVFLGLEKYSGWDTYITEQREDWLYGKDGTYNPQDPVTEAALPRTYLKWVKDRLDVRQRIEKNQLQSTIGKLVPYSVLKPIIGAERRSHGRGYRGEAEGTIDPGPLPRPVEIRYEEGREPKDPQEGS